MTEKKVWIHVGPPKTGTSALQRALLKNRTKLMQHGFFYPHHSLDANGISSGHRRFALFEPRPSIAESSCRYIWQKFLRSEAHTLVMSSEYFAFCVHAMAQMFPSSRFVFYCRNPLELLASQYNQRVKRAKETDTFSVWVEKSKTALAPVRAIERGLKVLAPERAVLRPYHRSMAPTQFDVLADFLSAIEGPHLGTTSQTINRSYGLGALELKRVVNGSDIEAPMHRWLDICLQEYSDTRSADLASMAHMVPPVIRNRALAVVCRMLALRDDPVLHWLRETTIESLEVQHRPENEGHQADSAALIAFLLKKNKEKTQQLLQTLLSFDSDLMARSEFWRTVFKFTFSKA